MRVTSCNKCRLSESAGLPQPGRGERGWSSYNKGPYVTAEQSNLDFATSASAWRVQLSALL